MKFSLDECTYGLTPDGRKFIRHEPSEMEVDYLDSVPNDMVLFALRRLVERKE